MSLPSSAAAREAAEGLGRVLAGLGLTRDAVARLAERGDDLRGPLQPTREALFSDEPVAVATRLLFCRVSVSLAEAEGALGQTLVQRLLDTGLVEAAADELQAPFHLRMVDGLFLFSDYLDAAAARDAVMGAGETTAILYYAAKPATRLQSALDLGCGAGTLALLLARDCERVVGTDVNERAVEFGWLNARVNGVDNVEFRCGSLWEPLAGEVFDRIVSQPPYYPRRSRPDHLTYLHGGERGDEIARSAMEGVAAHLSPDGRALVFTSWPDGAREPMAESLRAVELFTNRRELSGSRQSLMVLEHPEAAGAWRLSSEVSAECWGNVRPHHLDMLFANGEALQSELPTALRFAGGTSIADGETPVLRGAPGGLFTIQPIEPADALLLRAVSRGEAWPAESKARIREYLAKGWLRLR